MSAWINRLLVLLTALVPLAGASPAAAQATDGSYESPTYGFSITWDEDVWDVDEAASMVAAGPAALDRLRLVPGNGPALYIEGADYGDADAARCVDAESSRLQSDPTRGEYRPYVRPDGAELAGEDDGAAFAAFQYETTPETGDPFDAVVYINCRLIPGSGVSILFTFFARVEQFEPYLAETEEVIASLRLPAPGQATPVAERTPLPIPTGMPSPAPSPAAALDEAWFTAQVAAATAAPSIVGPLSGELVQDLERVSLALVAASEQDFYLRARFQNPSADSDAPWDFGVQFRDRNQPDQYFRLIIDSGGAWQLRQGTQVVVQSGALSSLVTAAGGVNALELVVVGDTGAFRLNGEELGGLLNLSLITDPGEVLVGAAFFTENTVPGAVTNFRDAELWRIDATEQSAAIQTAAAALTRTPGTATPTATPTTAPTATATATPAPTPTPTATPTAEPVILSPVDLAWFDAQVAAAITGPSLVGPVSDDLTHSMERVSLYLAATDAENFYLRTTFDNPAAGDEAEWDFGVAFRGQGGTEHYRLILDSNGRWYVMIGTDRVEQTGSVTSLDASAGGANQLELVVIGNTGSFRLNGAELVGPLDLSALSEPGQIYVGTAFSTATTIEGGVTRFRDLQVWPLTAEAVVLPTEPPVTATPASPTTTPAPSATPAPTFTAVPTATAAPSPTATAEAVATIPGGPTPGPTSSVPLIPTQVATGFYESTLFGYTLSWDAAWVELGRASADFDALVLSNGVSYVPIIGSTASGADARACQESAVREYDHLPEFSSVLVGGQPLADSTETRAWGVYRYKSSSGAPMAAYFECRSMPSQDATVLIAMFTPEETYNAQAQLLADLLKNLVLP